MRSRQARHLRSILEPSLRAPLMAEGLEAAQPRISPELTGTQYMTLLLHVAAEIEHALMVEYLFAAYTLGGARLGAKHQETVERWQETILGIAKEEMGHLITVQNVLRCISGPVSFERQELPFNADFYPFFFALERLTLGSLAKYVYAEEPESWTGPEAEEVTRRATEANAGHPLNRVGILYQLMIDTIGDPNIVPDEAFRADSVDYQASWNEWGRGYSHGARGRMHENAVPGTPDVIVQIVKDRASAVRALTDIARQGEATFEGEASHFARFLQIYREWKAIAAEEKKFDPSRPVSTNPIVSDSLPMTESVAKTSWKPDVTNEITDPLTFSWAHLFNIRYRLLLTGLTHSFSLRGSLASTTEPSARGNILPLVFSEMYKIRALSSILVAMPLRQGIPATRVAAGPPFQMPFTLLLPDREDERWRWYRGMLEASRNLLGTLRVIDSDERRRLFAEAMIDGDDDLLVMINRAVVRESALAEVMP
ncbi:MAG: ferritin-like domain-containing protein [Thermoanaerobaculia bacterium]